MYCKFHTYIHEKYVKIRQPYANMDLLNKKYVVQPLIGFVE